MLNRLCSPLRISPIAARSFLLRLFLASFSGHLLALSMVSLTEAGWSQPFADWVGGLLASAVVYPFDFFIDFLTIFLPQQTFVSHGVVPQYPFWRTLAAVSLLAFIAGSVGRRYPFWRLIAYASIAVLAAGGFSNFRAWSEL